jgi:hypothetical protein
VQVVLDCAQIAALLLSLDLLLLLPDWAARGMAFALITQMQTWEWIAFECLLPAGSAASAAVVQTILILLLPSKHARLYACMSVVFSLFLPDLPGAVLLYFVLCVPVFTRSICCTVAVEARGD